MQISNSHLSLVAFSVRAEARDHVVCVVLLDIAETIQSGIQNSEGSCVRPEHA